jgi:hypothetical protein
MPSRGRREPDGLRSIFRGCHGWRLKHVRPAVTTGRTISELAERYWMKTAFPPTTRNR